MKRLVVTFCCESEYGKRPDKGLHLLTPDQRALDEALEKINREDGAWDAVFIYCDRWSDLRAWVNPDSYMGPQYWGYVGLCGKSRDSDALERSNFECISDEASSKLGSKGPYNWLDEEMPVMETASASHWAVGWVETFMVYWADVDALDFAAEVKRLLDDYPVYDDMHFSETEQEEADECFESNKREFCAAVAEFLTGERDTDGFDEAQLENVAAVLFHYDVGCGGLRDAWVNVKDVAHHAKDCRWELTQEARKGNNVARLLLRKSGVKMPRKSRRKEVSHAD